MCNACLILGFLSLSLCLSVSLKLLCDIITLAASFLTESHEAKGTCCGQNIKAWLGFYV